MGPMEQSKVWRGIAEEARKAAVKLHDPAMRWQMLVISSKYEALARATEAFARIARGAASNGPQDTDSPEA